MGPPITGSKTISAHRTARNNSYRPYIHIFYVAWFNENMDVGVRILFLAVLCAEIVLLPVRATAISISGITRLPVDNVYEPGDIENMDIGVGILSLCPKTRDMM